MVDLMKQLLKQRLKYLKTITEKSNYINSYRLYFSQSPGDMQTK